MASILDTLIVNQQNQVAPNDRRFNMNEFLTAAGQVKNMNESLNEIQRQNSLRNLIAQRERDGVPFDRVSNEAAKYDLGKALSMRGEARESIGFNQQQSDIELKRFKSEMAGYWFGEVLRRTQAEGNGVEEIAAIAKEAAGLIAPYDSELAYRLLNMAQNDAYKRDALSARSKKSESDESKLYPSFVNKLLSELKDVDQESKKTSVLYWGNMGKAKVGDVLTQLYTMGHLPYLKKAWINGIYDYVKDNFHNGRHGIFSADEIKKAINELLVTSDAEAINNANIVDKGEEQLAAGIQNQVPQVSSAPKANTPQNNPEENDGAKNLSYFVPGTISKKPYWDADRFSSDFSVASDAGDIETLKKMKASIAADSANNPTERVSGGSTSGLGSIGEWTKMIDESIGNIEAQLKELSNLGVKKPEAKLKQFKDIFGARASLGTVLQFRNFHAFNGGYISKTPLTVLTNGLMVGTPNYKPIAEDYAVAKSVHSAKNKFQALQTLASKMNIPLLKPIAEFNNEYQALWSTASDVLKQARGVWEAAKEGLTDDETQQLKDLYTKMFGLDNNDWKLLEDRNAVYPTGDEYYRQLKELEEHQSKNGAPVKLNGVSKNEVANKSQSTSSNSQGGTMSRLEAFKAKKKEMSK